MSVTQNLVSVIPRRVGRKKRWAEDMQARFQEGTFARIEAVLSETFSDPDSDIVRKEDRTDFVREAVERELTRRERQKR